MSEHQFSQQGGQQAQFPAQQGVQKQPQQGGQQQGYRLQDVQTPQEAAAIDAITRAIETCEWCADQCITQGNPAMAECIRLCEDVSELGEASQVLLSRKSNYSTPVLQALEQAMQACAQECSRHPQAHCQDCTKVLGQSVQALSQLTRTGGQTPQQQGMTAQGAGQMASQMTGAGQTQL